MFMFFSECLATNCELGHAPLARIHHNSEDPGSNPGTGKVNHGVDKLAAPSKQLVTSVEHCCKVIKYLKVHVVLYTRPDLISRKQSQGKN